MTRGRVFRLLGLLVLAAALARWTGLIDVPGTWLFLGIGVDLLLGAIEFVAAVSLVRAAYLTHQRAGVDAENAFVTAVLDVEPIPRQFRGAFAKELRLWYRLWARLTPWRRHA